MSPEQWVAILTAATAVIAATGAVVVTVFNYLTSRDFGKTVKDMLGPINTYATQSASGLVQTNALFNTFMAEQRQGMGNLTTEVSSTYRVINAVDQRLKEAGI